MTIFARPNVTGELREFNEVRNYRSAGCRGETRDVARNLSLIHAAQKSQSGRGVSRMHGDRRWTGDGYRLAQHFEGRHSPLWPGASPIDFILVITVD
jgi:hypothetical protein